MEVRRDRLVTPHLDADAFFAGPHPELSGDGLIARSWRSTDGPALTAAFDDPDIGYWFTMFPPPDVEAWIAEARAQWSRRSGASWAVCSVDDPSTMLAWLSLHNIVIDRGSAEVGYFVVPAARGARMAARSLALLCEWAFLTKDVHRLDLGHSVGNVASCHVATASGFELEGVRRAQYPFPDGWHDMHWHARVAGDPPPERSTRGAPETGDGSDLCETRRR